MAIPSANTDAPVVLLNTIALPPPWEGLLLPVSGFPVPESELLPAQWFFRRLTRVIRKEMALSPEVFIQMAHLVYEGGGSIRFSDHGREWLPKLGLGVWPDRPPPTIWSKEDFRNLAPGEKPRTLMEQVFRITKSDEAKENAADTMLGLGTIVQILTRDSTEVFLRKAREVLLPPIKDPSYVCFPFYIPLLEQKSIAGATLEKLESWLSGASLYIRESVEDVGILIMSGETLVPFLKSLGGRLQQGDESVWQVPTEQ